MHEQKKILILSLVLPYSSMMTPSELDINTTLRTELACCWMKSLRHFQADQSNVLLTLMLPKSS